MDDERDIVKGLTIRLQSHGYEVVTALMAPREFSSAHKEKPDLVILDIRMPAGDGFSVAQQLKEIDPNPPISRSSF